MDEFSSQSRNLPHEDQLLDGISRMLGLDKMPDDSSDNASSFWKEKLYHTKAALESCEKNKSFLEKQNETLRRDNEGMAAVINETRAKIALLSERNKALEGDQAKEGQVTRENGQKVKYLENELALQKEHGRQLEQDLKERKEELMRIYDERKLMEMMYEKSNSKINALEEYGKGFSEMKELYDAKIRNYDTVIAKKDIELKQSNETIQKQAKQLEDIQGDTSNSLQELQKLKDEFTICCKEKETIELKFNDLREVYMAKSDKLSDECYSMNMALQKAYNDCDAYCKRIEDLEFALEEQKICEREQVGILKQKLVDKEEEMGHCGGESMLVRDRVAELETQEAENREEVQRLRELLTMERSKNLQLENVCEQKASESKDYGNQFEGLNSTVRCLEKELGEEKEKLKAMDETCVKLRDENCDLRIEVRKLKEDFDVKENDMNALERNFKETTEENAKIKQDIVQLSGERDNFSKSCQDLKGKNRWLCSVNEENEAEIDGLKTHTENLRAKLWVLREKCIDTAAALESLEKLRDQCSALAEEKNDLLGILDQMKIDKNKLSRSIEEFEQAIWKAKQIQTVAQSRIDTLENAVHELKCEKDSAQQKAEKMEKDHAEKLKEMEQRWEQKLQEKEAGYEKQLKRKEANEILMRRMDEQLKQKEAQLEVKRVELKRMLIQYSDLKNDKLRCEKKIESLQFTEKTLSAKVQNLEPQLNKLEEREKDLVSKLKQKETENRNINEKWEKMAAAGVEEITRAIWD